MCIAGPEANTDKWQMVAFVDGFGWLHRGEDTVVRFDPRHFPAGPAGESLRTAIETWVRNRQRRLQGEMAPGFPFHVNG